jgi:hypothetical protein
VRFVIVQPTARPSKRRDSRVLYLVDAFGFRELPEVRSAKLFQTFAQFIQRNRHRVVEVDLVL